MVITVDSETNSKYAYKIKNLNLALYANGKEYSLDILYGLEREDVYQCFQHENSRYSGFKVQAIAENLGVADVFLRWNTDSGHEEKISVGTYDTRAKNAANSLLKRINKRNIRKFFQYLKQGRIQTYLVVATSKRGSRR